MDRGYFKDEGLALVEGARLASKALWSA